MSQPVDLQLRVRNNNTQQQLSWLDWQLQPANIDTQEQLSQHAEACQRYISPEGVPMPDAQLPSCLLQSLLGRSTALQLPP